MSSSIRSDQVYGWMEEGTVRPGGSTRLPRAPQLVMVQLGEPPSADICQLAIDVRHARPQAPAFAQGARTVHDTGPVPVHDAGPVHDIGIVHDASSAHDDTTVHDTGIIQDASPAHDTATAHDTGHTSGHVRARLRTTVYKTTAVASFAVLVMWALGSVLFPNAQKEDVQHHGLSIAATPASGGIAQREVDPSDNSRAEQSATPVPTIEQAAYVVASANPAAQPQPQQGLSDQQRSQPQQGLNDQQQPQPQRPLDQQSQQSRPQQNGQRSLSQEEVDRLTNFGERFLAQGDVATARRLLEHAAQARSPRAALMLGATYDPDGLKRMGIVGIRPDLQQAHLWYTRAAEFGSREASQRLAALAHLAH